MAEKVITCPVCFDDDHCFEEVQKDWSSYMCFRCGFTSNSMYKTDSEELKTANEGATELMREVHFYDIDMERLQKMKRIYFYRNLPSTIVIIKIDMLI